MAGKAKIPARLQVWIDVRKKYHLSHAHIQMARELGINPKKLGKKANHRQEPWKAPLAVFIENLYFRRFGKRRPDKVKGIEELVKGHAEKKLRRRIRKQLEKQGAATTAGTQHALTSV